MRIVMAALLLLPRQASIAPVGTGEGQFMLDAVTPISPGATTTEAAFVVQVTVTDADLDLVSLEVEVAPAAGAYTGVPNFVSPLQPGGVISLTVAPGNFGWMWQWRAVDSNGDATPWSEFGGNPSTACDVFINGPPVPGSSKGPTKGHCGLTGFEAVIGLGIVALWSRRMRRATR
jgi:hypothetical protein